MSAPRRAHKPLAKPFAKPLAKPFAKPLAWRRAWQGALLVWSVTRVGYAVLTWAGGLLVTAAHPQSAPATLHDLGPMSWRVVFSRWTLWDGPYYLRIAATGYHKPIDAAFFPLVPFLIHLVEMLPGVGTLHGHDVLAGLVVGNLAALGALVALLLLAFEQARFQLIAERSVWMLAAYPLAFFLAAVYTDALFLALACAALLALRRQAWGFFALWSGLATLTRPTAVVLLAPALYTFGCQVLWPLWQHARLAWQSEEGEARMRARWRVVRRVGMHALALVGLCSGFAVAAVVLLLIDRAAYHGDALAFLHAQRLFAIVPRWPWQTVGEVVRDWRQLPPGGWQQVRVLADILPVVLLLVATVAGVRSRPVASTLYLAGVLLLILSSPIIGSLFPDPLAGAGRFVLAAVPLWLDLGAWSVRWPSLEHVWMVLGWLLQAVLVIFVVSGGWLI